MTEGGEAKLENRAFRLISLVLAVGILILLLKVLNWVPLALDRDIIRRYESIEEVQGKLKLEKIYIPSYFPQSLKWPPSEILAQGKPFPAVLMEFRDIEKGEPSLIITQAGSPDFDPVSTIEMREIKETVDYRLKGREAIIEVGSCHRGDTCSQIYWDEGSYRVTVLLKAPPMELIKIAESMLGKQVEN
jgi:hypothetical protein